MAENKYIRKITGGLLLGAAIISLGACDKVKLDDRYIPGEEVTAERTVLLEDFTGQDCVNCPDAHAVIEQLEEQYGDKLIAVSIHCGPFGLSTQRTNFDRGRIGLMTEEGNAIMESYGIQSFPMGTVDMGSPLTYDLWAGAVRTALQTPTDVAISDFTATYTPGENDGEEGYFGTIDAQFSVLCDESRSVEAQFWVLEDGIVAQQRSTTGSYPEYVHNNVFRAQVFNGLKGETVNLTADIKTTVSGSIQVRWTDKEHWNLPNLSLVCFVSDKSGVLQAAKITPFAPENVE